MPRHTFLDSILNRPSQNYAPQKPGRADQQPRWNAPPDLPNAPATSTRGSLLGSSIFRRKGPKSGVSGAGSVSNFGGSEAGASTSTMNLRTRFGRKKYESSSSFLADVSGTTGNGSFYAPPPPQRAFNRYPPPPSSVADSQATISKRKSRWWEAGSLTFGRRSRAPSIAGDSIFSEPEPPAGQVPWTSHGLAGIGAGTSSRRVTRSDYGTSPSRRPAVDVPPLPVSPLTQRKAGSVTSSAASPLGRLQSDVAPLGVSTLNPSLNKKPSRSKMPNVSSPSTGVDVRRTASSANLTRAKSPPPALPSLSRPPGSLAASPHVRRLSQDSKRGAADGTDWKDFMKSMAGTDIAKTWQGTRDTPDMAQAANGVRTSVNLERRKSHLERIQKELEQDAQFEQVVRDPGVVHQDLISRAANQVVGGLPPGIPDGYGGFISDLKPGTVIPTHPLEARRSSPTRSDVGEQKQGQRISRDVSSGSLADRSSSEKEESTEELSSSEEDEDDEQDESHIRKQTMLDVVNEEDEDASSQGTVSRRQSLMPSNIDADANKAPTPDPTTPKFKAFEAALNKSRGSVDGHPEATPPATSNALKVLNDVPAVVVTPQEDAKGKERRVDSDVESDSGSDDFQDTLNGPSTDDEAMETMLNKDDDRASQNSGNTGRVTVTFEEDQKDRSDNRSVRSTASRASRPGTLQRRLSDISLGTSFGVSNIMQIGRSRPNSKAASSRRIKLGEGDDDSAGSRSDDDDDEDLKKRIQIEQDRLRNMKVGDDFFGGSLTTILDKFDSKDWDEGLSAAVGQLGLDVGTQGSKRNSMSAQDVLALNAQERLIEVRKQRYEGISPSKQARDNSDARTMESGVAPSFAALWLLNQASDEKPKEAFDNASSKLKEDAPPAPKASAFAAQRHLRQDSNASSDGATTTQSHMPSVSHHAPSMPTMPASAGSPDKQTSVLDRPRHRRPKPREMGGVSIAQGKLLPDARAENPEDTRNILSDVWIPQTLSQMKEARAAAALGSPERKTQSEAGDHVSPPVSPVVKVAPSKDKPAPTKPAIKNAVKPSLSLADTLFSFSSDKTVKGKRSLPNLKGKGKNRSVQYGESQKKEKAVEVPSLPAKSMQEYRKSASTDSASRLSHDDSSQDGRSLHTPTAVRPGNAVLQAEDEDTVSSDTPNQKIDNASPQVVTKPSPEVAAQVEATRYEEDPSPLSSTRSPPPASELWSGESIVSTGPATPGVSEIFDRNAGQLPRLQYGHLPASEEIRPLPSPRDKKLPLPPVPTFEEHYYGNDMAEDATPLAVQRAEPIYVDQSKTPRAERDEPAFGMNVIPPTPPAEDVDPEMRLSSIDAPETLQEEDDAENEAGQAPQRSSSTKDRTISRTSNSLTRKSSVKRRSAKPAAMHEYQGHGLNLPPGLVATTVATTASRRDPQLPEEPVDLSSDPTAKSRRTKGRSKSGKERRARQTEDAPVSQTMQPSLSSKLASLTPPMPARSDASSSAAGSESNVGVSRSSSHSASPAVSVSERSSAVSSAVSSSAASDASSRGGGAMKHTSNGATQNPGRKIRTVTAGPNGHARTSLMSAISEWENSPVDRSQSASPMPHAISRSPSGYASPVPHAQYMNAPMAAPSGYQSPVYTGASSVTRSQSSLYAGSSPSLIRNAPVGSATDALLHPKAQPGANRRLSVPASDFAPWGTSYNGGEGSEGGHSHYSVTSLPNVPQSSYRARDPQKATNAIDDRLYAKTTMATVAVTSGAFRHKSIKGRKSSVDLRMHHDDITAAGRRASMDFSGEGMLVDELQKTTMALTSHTAPPRKLSSSQVLVQVIACAIDEMDKLLLREKVRNETAYGFVPGRSFCGRVMETGWEVKRMRLGDIVFGLQSSRKCGALAEFMTIEEDLVAKAPQDCLTMEQIAALPSVGVMAHQLMINHCSQLKRGSRILILNAHDGVGLLAMQECSTLGLIIVAHCPNQVSDGVALCEANGAHEVIVGEPLWALNTLHESSLDLVVDTVGGRRVYDASRRILAFGGQFCTFFGDLHSSGANPNLRSHLRSLRRSFFKKDAKQIGYEWVGTDTAEDCREALEAVRRAAEDGLICPRLKSVLAFGEGPRAFEDTLRGVEEEPGATVVRIS